MANFGKSCASLMTLVVLLTHSSPCDCGKVLFAMQQFPSHMFQALQIALGLMDRGHDVYMSASKPCKTEKILTDSGIKMIYYNLPANVTQLDSRKYEMWHAENAFKMDPLKFANEAADMAMANCWFMMHDVEFLNEIRAHAFDIVIYDGLFLTECMVILPHYLRLPHVFQFYDYPSRTPSYKINPAVDPAMLGLLPNRMTFRQKLQNVFYHLIEYNGLFEASVDARLLTAFGHGAKSWPELTGNSSLYLITLDFLLDWPKATFPNMIHTPGLTAAPAKPLPETLDSLVSSPEYKGVVLVTFGTILHIELTPTHIFENLISAFGMVPEMLFIFKYNVEDENILEQKYDIPSNVKLLKWVPQNDLLGHPRTKLFVSHGGKNGLHEAMYHGVPVLALPVFGDQFKNSYNAEQHGFAHKLDLLRVSPDELSKTIVNVADPQSSYASRATNLSTIMKNLPMQPRDKMAFWVDHVMRFGSHHLTSPAQNMSLWELYHLDVILFVQAVFISVLATLYCVTKLVIRRCAKEKRD